MRSSGSTGRARQQIDFVDEHAMTVKITLLLSVTVRMAFKGDPYDEDVGYDVWNFARARLPPLLTEEKVNSKSIKIVLRTFRKDLTTVFTALLAVLVIKNFVGQVSYTKEWLDFCPCSQN